MIVGQGPTVLAVNAVQVVWTFLSIVCNFSFLSPSLSFKTVFFHALDSMEIFSQLDLISSIQR